MQLQWLKPYFAVWNILKQYYKKPQMLMYLLAILILFSTLLSVFLPYLMKQIVDISQLDRERLSFQPLWNWNNLYVLATAYVLGWLFSNILLHFSNRFSAYFLVNIESALVYKGLENYFNLKYAEQKKIEIGVINTDIWRGASAFGNITYITLFVLVPIIFEILAMMWMLAHGINLSFAISFLFFAVLTFALTLYITFKSKDIFSAMYESRNQINQFFVETMQGYYEVQVNAAQQYELARFYQKTEQFRKRSIDSNKRMVDLMITQVLFVGLFLLSFMLFTVYLFKQQQVTTGDFVLISAYIIGLTMPILQVSQSLIHLRGDYIALKKFHQYYQLPKQCMSTEIVQENPIFYQFEHAVFQLGKQSIQNFNLSIEQGKCYLIIGETGVGKTSFIQYLVGLEHIKQGKLSYKNIDISQQFSKCIFAEIAVVAQSPRVYSGTLRQNLIHSSTYSYSDAELIRYLEIFHLDALLNKNKCSLDTDLQDIYKSFSGGEKQRISIIRALLKRPQCLIMDEPTAALNEEMGIALLTFIRAQVSTLVVISHAIYAKQFTDHLIDLDALTEISAKKASE